jgi:uncharacterized membrane protein
MAICALGTGKPPTGISALPLTPPSPVGKRTQWPGPPAPVPVAQIRPAEATHANVHCERDTGSTSPPLPISRTHAHLSSAFGDDWFGVRAEGFARFFGTPTFLIAQTVLVIIWIALSVAGLTRFDVYPFILLNLAFSLQAAYAAPLILLAQTRQSDRDKAHADADAMHREALAQASTERQELAAKPAQIIELLQQNTKLTQISQELSQGIKQLTDEIHRKVVAV